MITKSQIITALDKLPREGSKRLKRFQRR